MDGVLDLVESSDTSIVGGKAASLAKLIKAGFNVPSGFVITTNSSISEDAILKKFDELGAPKVAVRSSAVAEDGARDAWAGQFDTFLNVERSGLINAIKKCQASANSERAKAYAKEKSLQSGSIAVVIQEMVPAEISGVAFSAHPVTGNKEQIVIEAVSGLAEKLVSGSVTPDNYILNKEDLALLQSNLSDGKPLLDDVPLLKLAGQIIKIEKLYGFPIDVEWAWAEGRLYILQARPITTL